MEPLRQPRVVRLSLHLGVSIATSALLFEGLCTLDPGTHLSCAGVQTSPVPIRCQVQLDRPSRVPWEIQTHFCPLLLPWLFLGVRVELLPHAQEVLSETGKS